MATNINTLGVGLLLDAKEYIDTSKLAGAETRRLVRDIESARDPGEKHARQLDRLSRALDAGAINQATYNRLVEASAKKHKIAGEAADKHGDLLAKVGKVAKTVQAAIVTAAAAGIVATGKLAVSIREGQVAIDETAKAATKLGLTFNQLKGLQLAGGELAGADAGAIEQGVRDLQIRLAQAVGGNQDLQAAFAKLGIDAGQAMQDGPLQAILAIADGMEGVASQSERLELANRLMGESGAKLVAMLGGGRDAVAEALAFQEKWNSLTDAQVMGVEALNDQLGRQKLIAEGIVQTYSAEFAPVLSELLEEFTGLQDTAFQFKLISRQIADGWLVIGGHIIDIAGNIADLGRLIAALATGDMGQINAALADAATFEMETADRLIQEVYERREKLAKAAAEKEAEREAARQQMIQDTNEIESPEPVEVKNPVEERLKALGKEVAVLGMAADEAERYRLAMDGATPEQLEKFDRLQQELKAFEEEQQSLKDAQDAMQAASKYFEEERKRQMKMQEDIAKGPGSGMEAGSADAARFLAQQENARIAATVAPIDDDPTEEQLLDTAKRHYEEQKRATAEAKRQTEALQKLIDATKDNKIGRVR